ncbi:12918_t:CDS:1 [Acaulospora colombiana]|uniref:12918_t:CDS:1 n=1 Tax=Acaulospora colombiana TaxID=27376 RepID=A0ACA9L939_9GLOM|nr:12918_t:CDS:1 [Acaulospora colombiana]
MPPKKRTAPKRKQAAAIVPSTTFATSSEFPPGYGNIEILSSDNIIISFHCNSLTRVSPVFKEMLSTQDLNNVESGTPLVLEETAATIEHFLSHIEPTKVSQSLEVKSFMPFLETAAKYQASRIIAKVEKMATTKGGPLEYLALVAPMLLLSAAEKFRLPNLGAFAMSRVLQAAKEKVFTSKYPISAMTYVQIMEGRAERATWLLNKVIETMQDRFLFEADLPTSEAEDFYYYHQPIKKRKPKDPEHTRHCEECTEKILRGLIYIGPHVHTEPNWGSLLFDLAWYLGQAQCKDCGSGLRQDIKQEISRLDDSRPLHKTSLSAFTALRAEVLALESLPVYVRSLTSVE